MTAQKPSVAHAFAELADTLVDDFDLVDFLHMVAVRSQQSLGVEAVGILLVDNHGGLNVVAASSEQARLLELFQLQNAEGPCLDCYRTGQPVSCPDLAAEASRWPGFVTHAVDAGYRGVYALPMRLHDETIGEMNLFTATPAELDADIVDSAQALTDVATIALLHHRAIRQRDLLVEQLQSALNHRLAVEQAKGVVAERADVSVGEAFAIIREYARLHHSTLTDIAIRVVRRDPGVDDVVCDGTAGHSAARR